MQTQGTLQESDLASLLTAMQSERATGTLSLDSNGNSASLYFLFGHLFHATAGDGGQGEPVVLSALNWHDGSFLFDPRAKLPAEETIKASPNDLIAQAGPPTVTPMEVQAQSPAEIGLPADAPQAQPERDLAAAFAPQPTSQPPEQAFDEQWSPVEQTPAPAPEPTAASWDASPAPVPPAATPAWENPAPAEANTWGAPAEVTGESWEAANTWGVPAPEPMAPAAPVPRPEAAPAAFDAAPPTFAEAPFQPAAATEPAPPPPAAPMPEPVATPATAIYVPAEIEIPMYPLSAGKPMYQGLKAAFLDCGKLLRTLRDDKHTGYVRLTEQGYSAVLFFNEGHLDEVLSTEQSPIMGESAFVQFKQHMDAGSGVIDVVALSEDMVNALARAFTGVPHPMGLRGAFVDFPALLTHLADEKITGSILVAAPSETGVILLQEGRLVGAYTSKSKALSDKPDSIAELAKDPSSQIEVKTTGESHSIDVEAALARS